MTRARHLAVLVVTVVVAAAGLPLGAVVVPGIGPGTAAAQTAPTAACEIDGERYPEPGENVTLDASNTTDAAFVEFDLDGDGTYEVGDETDFRVTTAYEAGTYNASVRATNGSATDTAACGTLTVAANDAPSVGYDVETFPLEAGDTERFRANASDDDGSVVAYRWRVNGELVGETSTFDYTFPEAGEYTVNLTVFDDDGDAAFVSKLLTVEANDPPTAALSANRSTVAAGDAVAFDASGSSDDGQVVEYGWDFDADGTIDRQTDGPTVTHTYEVPPAGTFRPSVTVVDGDGASDTANVTLERVDAAPNATFVVNRTALVAPGGVLFDAAASSDPDGSIASYEWDLDGDGAAEDAGSTAIARYTAPGNYTATLTVTDDDGNVATANATVTVRAPNRPPVARLRPNRTVVAGESAAVGFDATSSTDPDGSIAAVRWEFDGDGSTDATGAEVVRSFPRPATGETTREVQLTVVDDDGTTDTATVLLTVTAERNRPPAAAFSVSPALPVPGDRVALNASASSDPDGSIASYEWDLDGDGTTDARGPAIGRNLTRRVTNVTLTVTDDDGATDAATRTINTTAIVSGRPNGTFDGGAVGLAVAGRSEPVLSYANLPPRANFTLSSFGGDGIEPGDDLQVFSRSSDPDGTVTGWAWYVDGVEVDPVSQEDGQSPRSFVTRLDAGTTNVTLVVTDDDGATARATRRIVAIDRKDDPTARFEIRHAGGSDPTPGEIVAGERIVLDASGSSAVDGRSIRRYRWWITALDGSGQSTQSGRQTALSGVIDSPGEYRITLSVQDGSRDTGRISRTITVVEPDTEPTITGIDADKRGATLEDAPLSKQFSATVRGGEPIDRVVFTLTGPDGYRQTRTDRSVPGRSPGVAETTFDLGGLSDDGTLTVTAVQRDGDRVTETRRIEVVKTPNWLDRVVNTGSVRIERASPTDPKRYRIVIERPLPKPPINIDFSPPGNVPLISDIDLGQFVLRSQTKFIYDLSRRTVLFDGDGKLRIALLGSSRSIDITGGGRATVDASDDWRIERLRLSAGYKSCCIGESVGNTWTWSKGPFRAKATLRASISIEQRYVLSVLLGERGGRLKLTGGQLAVGLLGRGGAAARAQVSFPNPNPFKSNRVTVGAGISVDVQRADLKGAIGFRTNPFRLRPAIEFRGRVRISGTIGPFTAAKTFRFGGKLGSANIGYDQLSVRAFEMEPVGNGTLRPAPSRLGRPPGDGTAARVLGIDARPQSVAGGSRLTEDSVRDGAPAVAYANGSYTAVWSRGDVDGAPGEFDVHAVTSADGERWTAPAPIADGNLTAFEPDVAAAGDRRATVWRRLPVPGNDTDDTSGPVNGSLALAVDDGTGWAPPVTIQDGNESAPAIAGADGRFLVAWIRDPDGNASTTADQRVRWAVYDDGSLGRVRTIPNATSVDVAGGPDGFTLAYLESDDGGNGSVVRTDLVGGRPVEADRYRVGNVTDLTAGPRSVAWTAVEEGRVTLRYADAAGLSTVPTDGVLGAADVELLTDAGRPLVVYTGQPRNASGRALFASRRTGGGWLAPERVAAATGEGGNLSVTGGGAAVGDGGLAALVAVRNVSAIGFADVFAVDRTFVPDLTVTARTDADLGNVSVGDRVRVNYTVRNVGSRAATTGTTLALETVGGTAATRTFGPLAPGDRATGTVTVEVGTGPTLRVDPEDALAEANESNNARSVALVRSDLTVGTLTRRGDGGAVVVEVGVRNRGPVPVANATVAVRVGNATLAQRRVDVPPTGTRRVRLRVQRGAVNESLAQRVVVDPDDAVAERDESNNVAGLRLLAVDLGIPGAGATTGAPGGVLADTFVSNAGPVDAAAAVTVAGNGTTLTYRFGVPGPDRPGSRAFERVRLYHPSTNGTLDLSVDPVAGADADGFDNVARTSVNASANDTAPVRIEVVATAPGNGTMTVDVRLSTDADVATGVPVTASAAGDPLAETTAVVPANDTRTVELNASTDASRLTVAVPGDEETVSLAAAPDVNGDGNAATDPDGDGLHEDVDGSGDFSIVDVAILLDRFDRPAVQDNVALFDFDGSGGVNVVDVAVLLEET